MCFRITVHSEPALHCGQIIQGRIHTFIHSLTFPCDLKFIVIIVIFIVIPFYSISSIVHGAQGNQPVQDVPYHVFDIFIQYLISVSVPRDPLKQTRYVNFQGCKRLKVQQKLGFNEGS